MDEAKAPSVVVVGAGIPLERCVALWRNANVTDVVEALELSTPDGFSRDLSLLAKFPAKQWRVYCAVSGLGLNMARLKLMIDVRMAGYRLASFVSPRAHVPKDWKVPDHAFIADGAVVEPGVSARHNLYVGPRSVIGFGSTLGHSVWIGAAATLGAKATVGEHTVIGDNVYIADGVGVGARSEVLIPGAYRESIPDKTFYSPMFENPVRIYRSQV